MRITTTVSVCIRVALVCLLSMMTACGGQSEQEKACAAVAEGYFPILNGIKCVFGSTEDGTAKLSETDSSDLTDEFEPNSTLNNANPVFMADATISISGSLNASTDAADNFIFTPAKSGVYNVYLCAETCDIALSSDSLNLMVLDQSQTTLAATSLGADNEKALSVHLNAGLAYYAEVRTFGATERYRLMIIKRPD